MLRALVESPGQLVTKDALFAAVWAEAYVSEAALTACIRELRRVLQDSVQAPRYIETVRGRGYRFVAPIMETPRPLLPAGPLPLAASSPTRLVGREAALAQLQAHYTRACQGVRQVVLVTGEAGIGKTDLVDAFVAQVATADAVWVGRGQCLDQYGAGEAYLPMLEAVERLCRGPGGQDVMALLTQQAPTWVVQMPGLVSPAELEGLQRRVLGTTRERMLREMAEALNMLTAAQPLVLVLEDLHWSDYSTLDVLAALARRREPARLLLLGTYRPPDALQRGHPLHTVQHELHMHGQCAELSLPLLSEAAVADYLATRFPDAQLPAGLVRLVHQRTEGNPLFIVQVVEDWVRRGWLAQVDRHWTLRVGLATLVVTVPEGLRQMLEQQLDRLSPMEQQVLEVGSVAGATFSAAAVAAGLEEAVVQVEEWCVGLARRQWLEACGEQDWPDGTVAGGYRFTHALYQEVAYTRLSAAWRAQLHRRIGEREEVGYGPQARERAAMLAVHFERGRDPDRALRYLQHAADNALRRFAYTDAITHLTKALALLTALPETPARAQQELDMQIVLGRVFAVTKGQGSPEVGHAFARARELRRQVGDASQLFAVLAGLYMFSLSHGEFQTARKLSEEGLTLAQHQQDPALLIRAYGNLGITLHYLGETALAYTHLEQAIALHALQPDRSLTSRYIPEDPVVAYLAYAAFILWTLGYPDQALTRIHQALTLAQKLLHASSLARALHYAAWLRQSRREADAVQELAEASLALSTEQGFTQWVGNVTFLRGWALATQGQDEEGIAQMQQGLTTRQATGAEAHAYVLAILAEAYGGFGQAEEGLRLLAEALAVVESTGERCNEAELYRIKGELLLQQAVSDTPQAEACFQQALAVARRQQAKSWELRAAMSLSRLWQQQGKQDAARALLAPIYGWFTEGFDTADLKDAQAFLSGEWLVVSG